jgi:phosphomannomutase
MPNLIISVSGLRGVIGDGLTPDVAIRYCAAFADQIPAGPLVVTRDGRTTGPMIAEAVKSSLRAMGREVIYADVAATPTTGVLIRHLGAAGGIQISASHNPPEYNGLKLFGGDGRVIEAAAGDRVLQHFQSNQFGWATYDRLGGEQVCSAPHQAHLEAVLKIVDVQRIRKANFRVVLDANHGAGSQLGKLLLDALQVETVLLGESPDGLFEHPPEPTAENLQGVGQAILQSGAAVGFCQDPDADRLALIDEAGRYIGEEFTVAICLDHVLQTRRGPVITNCSTSRMSEDLAQKYDVPFYRSKVGEANVTAEMIQRQAVFGGEGNGGPIDPRVGYVRDSFVGMALVLDAMAQRQQKLSDLADSMPQYAIYKDKVQCDTSALAQSYARLESHFSDAIASHMDGLRLDWPNSWLLIRPSNTEPIVRIIAEAPTQQDAAVLCERAAEVLTAR